MKVILYIILLLIDMSLLCKVESFIEKKEEITENEEHPLFASFIECIAEDTNLQYAVQYYRFFVIIKKNVLYWNSKSNDYTKHT